MTPDQHALDRGPRATYRRPHRGWDSLTPAEAMIAALVAEGMTNPQIAARLSLSRRTVATHVSDILGKLDVRSRTDIARVPTLRETFLALHDPELSWDQLIEPDQKEQNVAPEARSREKAQTRQPTLSGRRLSAVAARLLPAGERARYGEEYRSELHDLAAAGAGRRQQLGYAIRLLARAVPLRLAVLAPRRGKASP